MLGSLQFLTPLASQRALGVLRVMAGLLFLEHGSAKLFGFPHVTMYDHLEVVSFIGFGGLIELIGGAMVALGLYTRVAAFVVSGEMAVGYFLFHAPRNFYPAVNGGDAAILYCFIFLFIAIAGPGGWSLDGLIARRRDLPGNASSGWTGATSGISQAQQSGAGLGS